MLRICRTDFTQSNEDNNIAARKWMKKYKRETRTTPKILRGSANNLLHDAYPKHDSTIILEKNTNDLHASLP